MATGDIVVRCTLPGADSLPPLPYCSLLEYVQQRIGSTDPNHPYSFDDYHGRSYTRIQVVEAGRRVASALHRRGLKPKEMVCVLSPNHADYVPLLWGVIENGAILTSANPAYTVDEVVHQLKDSGSVFLVCHESNVDTALRAAKKVGTIRHVFYFHRQDTPRHSGCTPFSDLLNDNGFARPTDVKVDTRNDVIIMPYSSGTTGLPKGVMLTHRNIVAQCEATKHVTAVVQQEADSVYLMFVPMYHTFGILILITELCNSHKIVLQHKFEPKAFLEAIQKYEVTNLPMVPPIALFLIQHPMVDQYNLSSIRRMFAGAAPLSEDLQKRIKDKFGVMFRQVYGLTETAGMCHIMTGEKTGSIGHVLYYLEAKIVDPETAASLGPHGVGELYVRGPVIMKGYHGKPDATLGTVDTEGWLHTGDLCYYDEEGLFYYVERLKELIKYKGLQVAPLELENLLLSHPAIVDAAVIGIPDDRAGELPKAFVVKKPHAMITERELVDFVAERVADHKRLQGGLQFMESIPKLPTGKILRRVLRELVKKQNKTVSKL